MEKEGQGRPLGWGRVRVTWKEPRTKEAPTDGQWARVGPVCRRPPRKCCLPGPEAAGARVPRQGLHRQGQGVGPAGGRMRHAACAETLAPGQQVGKGGPSTQVAGRVAMSILFGNENLTRPVRRSN